MALVEMQKISVCALKKNRKKTLETLQHLGVLELTTEEINDPDLGHMDTSAARGRFLRRSERFESALKVLAEYAPVKTGLLDSLAGKKEISRTEADDVQKSMEKCYNDAQTVNRLAKEITDTKGEILKNENRKTSLEPWMKLDVSMAFKGTKKTRALIGTMPGARTAEEIYAIASEGLEGEGRVSVDVLFSENDATGVVVLCLRKDRDKVSDNLRARGFARPAMAEDGIPSDIAAEIDRQNADYQKKIEELGKKIAGYADRREKFKVAADYYRTRAEKYRLLATVPQSENAFFLTGWLPKDKESAVAKLLEKRCGASVSIEEVPEEEIPPTLLKNNSFSESVEPVLASYGLPTKGHVDPTFVMSFFYVIFFGMMLSDAGYGLVMAIACAVVLKKYPKMESGLRKSLKLFFWCGLSTTFWGFMYGGFFGDAIDVVAHTFLGVDPSVKVLKPLWFEPLADPMRLLVWCMLFGIIHLFAGLAMKGYEILKDGDVLGFVSDVVSWYMFLMGLILMLLPSDLFKSISGMEFNFPPFMGTLSKFLALAGMLIILLMSGRSNKNWALRIALGAYDIYGVTSWLSDVLSYSRLLALGLATGVIGSVINMMGSMGKNPIVFILVFLIGHTLNIAINALGAYVHTNRLQFVEFFGKFYEGGGKPFSPFKEANKYIEIKEER